MLGRFVRLLLIPTLLTGASTLGGQQVRPAGASSAPTTIIAAATARPTIPPDARAALIAAYDAHSDWNFNKAYELYGKALEIDSTLGIARILQGQIANATARGFQRGIQDVVGSGAPIPLVTFALGMAANGAEATALLGAAKQLFPKDPRVDLELAMSIAIPARFDSLRAIMTRYPDFAPAAASLSYSLLLPDVNIPVDSLLRQAIDAAGEAIRRAPGMASGHSAMARALAKSGRYAEASEHARRALKIDPWQMLAHIALAEAITHDATIPNRVDRARAEMDSAILSVPSLLVRAENRRTSAQLYMHDGRVDQMEQEMLALAREGEKTTSPVAKRLTADTYGRLATLLAAAGRAPDSALAGAMRIDPAPGPSTVYAYALSKQSAKARAALETWTAATPPNPNTACATAMVLYAEKKYAEAIATATSPFEYTWCQVARYEALIALGKTSEAEGVRTEFLNSRFSPNTSMSAAILRYRGLAKKK
jgi:tetratricopeptide (TPR) repeat protein